MTRPCTVKTQFLASHLATYFMPLITSHNYKNTILCTENQTFNKTSKVAAGCNTNFSLADTQCSSLKCLGGGPGRRHGSNGVMTNDLA